MYFQGLGNFYSLASFFVFEIGYLFSRLGYFYIHTGLDTHTVSETKRGRCRHNSSPTPLRSTPLQSPDIAAGQRTEVSVPDKPGWGHAQEAADGHWKRWRQHKILKSSLAQSLCYIKMFFTFTFFCCVFVLERSHFLVPMYLILRLCSWVVTFSCAHVLDSQALFLCFKSG